MRTGQQVVLVSGLSGAGKSVVLKSLEDMGYYCLDNLPAPLLTQAASMLDHDGYPRLAIGVDARSAHNLATLPRHIEEMRALGCDVRLIFLDARDEVLIRRYSETRRSHPLARGDRTISECVRLEREILAGIRELGLVIDTTGLSARKLCGWIRQAVTLDRSRLTLIFESFGFKHGLAVDADFAFDARCLPNPFYELSLRPLTGLDQPVIEYLQSHPLVEDYCSDILALLERWLPRFDEDQRSYVTVAIGCTGGQHRSVYLVERLVSHFQPNWQVMVRHRELPLPHDFHAGESHPA